MQAVLPFHSNFVGRDVPVLAEVVHWGIDLKSAHNDAWWFKDALNKGPTDDGGGLMRMDSTIHLFPPGQPADPNTCIHVRPGEWFAFDKDLGWAVFSNARFHAEKWTTMKLDGLEFHFEYPANQRFARYGIGLSQTRTSFDDKQDSLWWVHDLRRWTPYDEFHELRLSASSMKHIRTFRALRSHIRRHRETLKGRTMVWATRYDQTIVRIPA